MKIYLIFQKNELTGKWQYLDVETVSNGQDIDLILTQYGQGNFRAIDKDSKSLKLLTL